MAVFNFITSDESGWGGLPAAATLIALPILLVQRHIVRGLTAGGLKE